MNEDRKVSEEKALRSLRGGGAFGEDRDLHGLTRGSAGEGQAALRELMRAAAGGSPEPADPQPADAQSAGCAPGGEEQALRDLLRGAVGRLEPSGDALERLRHAVPRRRARKRQALVAAAAAALLVGTAVPAALRMTGARGEATDHSAMAGHGRQEGNKGNGVSDPHQNGTGSAPKPTRPAPGTGQGAGGATGAAPTPAADNLPPVAPNAQPTGGTGVLPGGSAAAGTVLLPPPAAPGVPGCNADQLGVSGSARSPEADGKVYGSFKVTNVSGRGCTVLGPDTVTAAPASGPAPGQGGAEVAVVGHTAGDPATGLPDPSAEVPLMVLAPNAAYEVRFAWVPPAQNCPATGNSEGSEAPRGSTNSGPGVYTGPGAATDQLTVPPAPDATGVAVSHTPNTPLKAAPTTQTTIPDACGGTVYRTGAIPLAEKPKP
ncbi:hypothetical protein ACFWCB_03555 [Streptomyces sp. NPDC060048]|uniref:hypothetical protein n=1 Tax=unclassified Streptomyces TaxID=2593676 RepID=UPI00369C95F7